jgi:hypothetical protein
MYVITHLPPDAQLGGIVVPRDIVLDASRTQRHRSAEAFINVGHETRP